jgi:LacI family transcriptional regulator
MGRETRIALFMGLNDTYDHGITRGVTRYAKSHRNWRLYGYGWMFRPLEALEHWRGEGIIARVESRDDARRLAALGVPVIDVAGAYLHPAFNQVNNDDEGTGRLAAEHLLSCGFKRFAYCGVTRVGWSEKRKSGFIAALGGSARNLPVFEESLPWWEQLENSHHLRAWLRQLEVPVGIFACNDTAGLKLSELCGKIGLEVPETVAILGVDNEDVLCEMAAPTLSSIALDCETIGYRAAGLLDEQLTRGRAARAAKPWIRVPPLQVVARESTRVYACEDPLVEQAVRYIRSHVAEAIKVPDVLSQVAASRRSLEKRFRTQMGHSLHTEIIKARLDYAKALLRNTDRTVSVVAEESGFHSAQRFHRVFKDRVGLTPAGYRSTLMYGAGMGGGGQYSR